MEMSLIFISTTQKCCRSKGTNQGCPVLKNLTIERWGCSLVNNNSASAVLTVQRSRSQWVLLVSKSVWNISIEFWNFASDCQDVVTIHRERSGLPDYQPKSINVFKTSGKNKLSRRVTMCHYNSNMWTSVTKLQSQRRHPIPRKWKCHSHPMSVSQLCLFLDLDGLWVWLLRVCLRHLINTKAWTLIRFGREQEGMVCWLQSTRSYKITLYNLFWDLPTAFCKYVEAQWGFSSIFLCAPLFIHCWQKRTESYNQRWSNKSMQTSQKTTFFCLWDKIFLSKLVFGEEWIWSSRAAWSHV